MILAAVREQTQFKFNDHVLVLTGFYRGMSGRVTRYMPKTETTKSFFGNVESKKVIEYHIKTDTGNLDILVDENQIKLSGNK